MDPSEENLNNVAEILNGGIDAKESVRDAADEQLEELKSTPGFLTCLVRIFTREENFDEQTRLLAAIYFKRLAEGYWYKRVDQDSQIFEERLSIQEQLLHYFSEPNDKIAIQIAASVAIIAKIAWPKWEDLFPTLGEAIQTDDPLIRKRGLKTLQLVLKDLSAKKFLLTKKHFQATAPELLGLMKEMWTDGIMLLADSLQNFDSDQLEQITEHAQMTLLLTKCLRYLLVFGIADYSESSESCELFPAIIDVINTLMPSREQIYNLQKAEGQEHPLMGPISAIIVHLARIACGGQKRQPMGFRPFLIPYIDFFTTSLDGALDDLGNVSFDGFTIECLNYLSNVISSVHYQGRGGLSFDALQGLKADPVAGQEAKDVLSEVFNPGYLSQLTELLVSKFFPLRDTDLQHWADDPETYYLEDKVESAGIRVRPAAERLFRTLLDNFKDLMAELMLQLLGSVADGTGASMPDLLFKEAVYFALGVASNDLFDHLQDTFEFSSWYENTLQLELNSNGEDVKFIRRRIIWLLGEWVDIIPLDLRGSIYSSIATLLAEDDLVVRMTAIGTLQRFVNDFSFLETLDPFMEHLSGVFDFLFQIVADATKLDTRNDVMRLVQVLVETLGNRIAPVVPSMIKFIPELWDNCQEMNILQSTIIQTLYFLVKALQHESLELHSFLVPILHHCLSFETSTLFLVKMGFELLHCLVRFSPVMTDDLMVLYSRVLQWQSKNTDNLDLTLMITESYAVLGESDFLDHYGNDIANNLNSLPQKVNDLALRSLTSIMDILSRLYPFAVLDLFSPVLEFMLTEIVESKNRELQADIVLAGFLHVIGRLLYHNYEGMFQFIGTLVQNDDTDEVWNAISTILEVWIDKFDSFSIVSKKKTCVLGMLECLRHGPSVIIQHLEGIITCCTGVLLDLESADYKRYQAQMPESDPDMYTETERIAILEVKDPITEINLRDYALELIDFCQNGPRGNDMRQCLANVSPFLLDQLQNPFN